VANQACSVCRSGLDSFRIASLISSRLFIVMRVTFDVETNSAGGVGRPDTRLPMRQINPAGEKPRDELIVCISRNAGSRYGRLIGSTDYYVVFRVSVDRLIECAGKASGGTALGALRGPGNRVCRSACARG
jgi:hypothetical protein